MDVKVANFKPFWKLKTCPRCHGDIYVEAERESCLQCGYERSHKITSDKPLPIVLEIAIY